ncbi:hypothetical protein DFP72DRAFT_862616 [Ephemerocybe angulata]|uniref:Uncharacterized protein n=1 Tax=Ephemerocybe angulata TaxID=980116 RepID=A0A8H6H6H1_9AGAR|nr:hypothetical protein DFP72DRAFT_862616 [Tulosesus angulatus]
MQDRLVATQTRSESRTVEKGVWGEEDHTRYKTFGIYKIRRDSKQRRRVTMTSIDGLGTEETILRGFGKAHVPWKRGRRLGALASRSRYARYRGFSLSRPRGSEVLLRFSGWLEDDAFNPQNARRPCQGYSIERPGPSSRASGGKFRLPQTRFASVARPRIPTGVSIWGGSADCAQACQACPQLRSDSREIDNISGFYLTIGVLARAPIWAPRARYFYLARSVALVGVVGRLRDLSENFESSQWVPPSGFSLYFSLLVGALITAIFVVLSLLGASGA